MATAELPRPGVEIIQEFRAASPTVLRPTLVPCIVGVAKEIVEVQTADGLLNENAKQGEYEQLPRVISQSSFPSPRDNIDEVDVEEATIRAFFQFGGSLRELERDPGESFLVSHNHATRAAFRSDFFVTGTGLDLDGLVLVIAIDVAVPANTTEDVTVTFDGTGNLTPTQIVDQINAAVGEDVASEIVIGSNSRIQIASLKYGAASSVTIRGGGSANEVFGLASASSEYRVVGSGLRAQDQNNNTTLSPWIEWTEGAYTVDDVDTSLPAYEDDTPAATVGFGFLDDDDEFNVSFIESATAFTGANSLDLEVGDAYYADGLLPNTSAVVMKVEAARFKLGILNTRLSTIDDDGNVVSAVYDASSVSTLLASVPFAPRYGWFLARNLEVSTTATAAELTGSKDGTAATAATVTAPNAATGYPLAAAGLTLEIDVTVDGVQQDTQTFTFTGGPFANLAAVVDAINDGDLEGVFAHTNLAGDRLALSTDVTGATQEIVLKDTSTALTAVGFVDGTEYSDEGTDVEFVDMPPVLTSTAHTFPFTAVVGETLLVQISTDGGATYPTTRTFTHAAAGPHANIAALLAAINTAGNWDGGTLPTQFVVTNSGNTLVITGATGGSLRGLRIGSASTGIGVTSNGEIGFTSLQEDLGEENLNGQTLQFQLNDRPKTYEVLFTSDSLVDAVASINEAVGWPVASISDDDLSLTLTSGLLGYASKVEVLENSTTTRANAALGFGSGNTEEVGDGRPSPDFYVDNTGSVVLGAEVLRSQLTGIPYNPGVADIYIQYRGVRKDVSPLAEEAGLLRLDGVTTLENVLSPVNADNPLALGMFFALINAAGLEVAGLGVDAASGSEPYGTTAAYARAAEFLEAEEIYVIAPMTHSEDVAGIFKAHVEMMSAPEQKGERILFVCPEMPERHVDTVIASGLSGETTATPGQFVCDVNPTPGLVAAGFDPLELEVDDDVFLEIEVEGEVRRYSLESVNGVLAVVRTTFASDENADAFFSVATLNEALVNADWAIKVRGTLLLISGSTLPDKTGIAETVAAKANAYLQRRMYVFHPDTVIATVDGTEQNLPGFYLCAGAAGMVAKFPPQQGFTNLAMVGYSGVVGSSDYFSNSQLNKIAGGGVWIVVQDVEGAPLTSRHQLSTNITTIETRELSITKVVDFCAKVLRTGLRNFIGQFNITQPFLDTLSTAIQGMLSFLVENGIIIGGELNNLIQSKDAPDVVLVDVTLDVPYPCNYIRLTLVI
jgi:hypothetical protein